MGESENNHALTPIAPLGSCAARGILCIDSCKFRSEMYQQGADGGFASIELKSPGPMWYREDWLRYLAYAATVAEDEDAPCACASQIRGWGEEITKQKEKNNEFFPSSST